MKIFPENGRSAFFHIVGTEFRPYAAITGGIAMRTARIKAHEQGYYHCISRIIERRHILGPAEKRKFYRIMRKYEAFCGLRILTYAIMSSHFHLLIHVPPRKDLSDSDLLQRLTILYKPHYVADVAARLKAYRDHGHNVAADLLKDSYTYRMYDLSHFMQSLKQVFSQYYNRRTDRCGTLWDQRFKSILVEDKPNALLTMAVYIDLNAVRGGLVTDPKDYRYCGYGEAMGGGPRAREGLKQLMSDVGSVSGSWRQIRRQYRQWLFEHGQHRQLRKGLVRPGFSPERVEEVLRNGGRLPKGEILRCKVRYFSDGLVLGSKEFVEKVFEQYRAEFGIKRRSGARPLRYGEWNGLYTMRDLRKAVIFIPTG